MMIIARNHAVNSKHRMCVIHTSYACLTSTTRQAIIKLEIRKPLFGADRANEFDKG
jgi:hypothetical protein